MLISSPWTTLCSDLLTQRKHSFLPETPQRWSTHMQYPLLLHSTMVSLIFMWSFSSEEKTQKGLFAFFCLITAWQTDPSVSPSKTFFFPWWLAFLMFPYKLILSWKHWAQLCSKFSALLIPCLFVCMSKLGYLQCYS